MKARTRIGLLLFTISAASLAGLAIRNGIAQQEVKADGEYTFKLDYTYGAWNNESAKTVVYAFGNSGNQWFDAVDEDPGTDKIATITIPSAYHTFVIVAVQPDFDVGDPKWSLKKWQTDDIAINASKDYVTITGCNGDHSPYDYDKLVTISTAEGNRFYVDASACDYWEQASASTYLYIMKGVSYEVLPMQKTSKIDGWRLYYVNLSEDIEATKFKVIRGVGFDGSSWDGSVVFNQTGNIEFTNANKGYRAVKLGAGAGDVPCTYVAKDDAFLADVWGRYFLSFDLCYDEGGVKTGWKSAFTGSPKVVHQAFKDSSHLSNDNYFRTISNEGSDPINRAILRYDTIWVKNAAALSDIDESRYLNRNPSFASLPQGALVTIEKQDVAFPVGISCVSLLGIAGLGGLLLLKKKKEQ